MVLLSKRKVCPLECSAYDTNCHKLLTPSFVLFALLIQFHDGLGFFVSHVLVTNTFEYSLQLVNPKLTVPYWEFTVESSSQGLSKYVESMPETRSPLLQTSWFGSSDPIDHVVRGGREKSRVLLASFRVWFISQEIGREGIPALPYILYHAARRFNYF